MKTLSAGAQLRSGRRYAEPGYLVQIDFTAPSAKTLYLSDVYRNTLGQEWLPLVQAFGSLETMLNVLNVDGRPATAQLTLYNTVPIEGKSRISDLIRTPVNTSGSYEWAFAKVTVYQLFAGLTSGDEVKLGVFYLEDPTDIGEDLLTVRMSDQTLVLENQLKIRRVNRDDLTSCPPSEVGRSIPIWLGQVSQVPAIWAIAGIQAQLNEDLDASETAVDLVDASALPLGSITIMVDAEHITGTHTAGSNTLTSCTRGANTTTAVAHTDKALVYEVRSSYVAIVAENISASFTAKALTNVRVNGRLPATSPTVSVDDTGVISGRRVARITFSVVDANRFHVTQALGKLTATNLPLTIANISALTGSQNYESGGTLLATRTEFHPDNLTRHAHLVFTNVGGGGGSANLFRKDPVTGVYIKIDGWNPSTSRTFDVAYTTGDSMADDTFRLEIAGTTNLTATLVLDVYEVGGATGSRSNDSTAGLVIGDVTVDIEGVKDDGSGTISGTPSLRLDNPADITRFILTQLYPGISSGDLGSSWATTRGQLAAEGIRWAFGLDYTEFSRLRRRLGEQARSALSLESGKWEYVYLPAAPTASFTLDYAQETFKDEPMSVRRTVRTELVNSLTVRASKDPSTGTYETVTIVEDLTQPGLSDRLSGELALDFVQDPALAIALGGFWLSQWSRQRLQLDLVTWWNALPAEIVDYFRIANHPILAAFGGSDLIFRVTGLQRDLNTDRVRIQGIEAAYFPVPASEGDEALRAGHIWGLTVSNNAGDATNDLDIAVGEAVSDDAASANRVLMELTSGLTKQIDATWAAGTNAGGRVSGQSLADGTWGVYAFRRQAGGIDVCLSNSLTFTTPDSGTNRRLIALWLRESGVLVPIVQDGDYFERKATKLDLNAAPGDTNAHLLTLSVPTLVPVIARFNWLIVSGGAGAYVRFSDPAVNDEAPSTTVAPLHDGWSDLSAGAIVNHANLEEIRTNASGQVRYRLASNQTIRVSLRGWTFRRGRDA